MSLSSRADEVTAEDLREAGRNLAHVHAWFLKECTAPPDSGEAVDVGSRAAFERLCDAMEALDRATPSYVADGADFYDCLLAWMPSGLDTTTNNGFFREVYRLLKDLAEGRATVVRQRVQP